MAKPPYDPVRGAASPGHHYNSFKTRGQALPKPLAGQIASEPVQYLKEALIKCVGGVLRKFYGIILLQFLEIHKVFLRNCAAFCRKIFSQSALADLISPSLKDIGWRGILSADEPDFSKEYCMYFKKNLGSMAAKGPSSRCAERC